MPSAGKSLRYDDRDYVFDRGFHKEKLVEKNNLDLSYIQCRDIIHHANKLVANIVENEIDGFKLPLGMGYLCVTKYIPEKAAINWKATKELGKYVYHTNMHTEGYTCRVMWFRVGRASNTHFHEIFKFKAMRDFARSVSAAFAGGKSYNEWTIADFIEKGRLQNLYNKKYLKNLNEV